MAGDHDELTNQCWSTTSGGVAKDVYVVLDHKGQSTQGTYVFPSSSLVINSLCIS